MPRYSAKLLFIWDPDPVTGSRRRRLCEERIVTFQSRSARDAVRKARAIGKAEQLHFDSGHRLRFAGVLQCMDLEFQDPSEVWWEYQRRSNPGQWARKMIPSTSALYVFTDKRSEASKSAKKPQRPTSRAERGNKSKRRSSTGRG
jgi:hypothetical protein